MDFVITKNNFAELNCFFTRTGFDNISRPQISYLKIDSASNIQPIFHIGFKENMGFLDSVKINAGVMIFEVLEGYPLQDLIFKHNAIHKKYKFRLEDLEPMDFYCIQENNKDVYGDFILKNVKFTSTKMEQSVENFGRRMIAEFVCSEMLPFRLPYFFNNFISDDYDYHIIRNKEEIRLISMDVRAFSNNIDRKFYMQCMEALGQLGVVYFEGSSENYADSIIKAINYNMAKLINHYIYKVQIKEDSPVIKLQRFIKFFYRRKNEFGIRNIQNDKRLNLTNIGALKGEVPDDNK